MTSAAVGDMPRSIDLREVLDARQLGPFRVRVIILCALIAILDGFDVQAMAFVAPVLGPEWQVDKPLMGQILMAGLAGLMLGTMIFGALSDRIGRRRVLIGSTIGFGLLSLATATAATVPQLMFWRFATGLGLGGEVVSALALAAEFAPTRSRATLVTTMFVGFPLGGSLGGILSAGLIANFGWQSVFIAGGILPLLFIALAGRFVPESPSYLLTAKGEMVHVASLVEKIDPTYRRLPSDIFVLPEERAERGSLMDLFRQGRLAGTLIIWSICFSNLLIMYLMITWLPTIFEQSGLSLDRSIYGAVAFNMGGVIGGLVLSRAVDRLGAFRVLAAAYCATALIIFLASRSDDLALTFALTALAGTGVIGSQFCMNALAAGYYPTAIRSTGVGWALGIGRIGALIGPLLGGLALAAGWRSTDIFAVSALPALACSGLVLWLGVTLAPGKPPQHAAR